MAAALFSAGPAAAVQDSSSGSDRVDEYESNLVKGLLGQEHIFFLSCSCQLADGWAVTERCLLMLCHRPDGVALPCCISLQLVAAVWKTVPLHGFSGPVSS